MIGRAQALRMLDQCDGEEIWSLEFCRSQRVPEPWIRELRDAYESGYQSDRDTIYYQGRPITQFEGVLAVDLAVRLAGVLGISVAPILASKRDRSAIVAAIREAAEEG